MTSDFLATGGDDFAKVGEVDIDDAAPPYRDRIADRLRKRGGVLRPGDWLAPTAPRIVLPQGGVACAAP